jgi:hypothetical protein
MRVSILRAGCAGLVAGLLGSAQVGWAAAEPEGVSESEAGILPRTPLVAAVEAPKFLRRESCSSSIHIVAARGTSEPPGTGVIGFIAKGVSEVVPGTTVEGLDYPAVFVPYNTSEAAGVASLRSAVANYTTKCPNAKIALLGYSQVRFGCRRAETCPAMSRRCATGPLSADHDFWL